MLVSQTVFLMKMDDYEKQVHHFQSINTNENVIEVSQMGNIAIKET